MSSQLEEPSLAESQVGGCESQTGGFGGDGDSLCFHASAGSAIPMFHHGEFMAPDAAETQIDESDDGSAQALLPRDVARPLAKQPSPIYRKQQSTVALAKQSAVTKVGDKTVIVEDDDIKDGGPTTPPSSAGPRPPLAVAAAAAVKSPPAVTPSVKPPPPAPAAPLAKVAPPAAQRPRAPPPAPTAAPALPLVAAGVEQPLAGAEQRGLLPRLIGSHDLASPAAGGAAASASAATNIASNGRKMRQLSDEEVQMPQQAAKLIRGEPRERRAALSVTHVYAARTSMPHNIQDVFKKLWRENIREGFVSGSPNVVFTVNYKIEERQQPIGYMQY